ncbi:MAG: hypothetical protein IH602_17125 [Bryobacteraceae bacterium]|nr:hypothetical protein [Bryobacteraceae bacterium]
MSQHPNAVSRRDMIRAAGAASLAPALQAQTAAAPALNAAAGVDRVTILPGKTYLSG